MDRRRLLRGLGLAAAAAGAAALPIPAEAEPVLDVPLAPEPLVVTVPQIVERDRKVMDVTFQSVTIPTLAKGRRRRPLTADEREELEKQIRYQKDGARQQAAAERLTALMTQEQLNELYQHNSVTIPPDTYVVVKMRAKGRRASA